jgi:uncharacterized protein
MKYRLVSLSIFAALSCGLLITTDAAPTPRRHFIWRIKNAPAPFYLVGSMHALRQSDYFALHDFDRAINDANVFVFERDPTANDPAVLWRKLLPEASYPHGVTIQQRVSPRTFALVQRIARIPQSAYETQKPWAIAAFNLKAQGMEMVKSRFSLDHYIYENVRHRAKFGGLETIDEFAGSFTGMSDRESESFLLQAIEYGQRSPELLSATIAAWKAGSPQRVYELYAPRKNGADGYSRWIEKRSAHWLPRIDNAIRSRAPTMVVVGALHLGGPRGLIALLRARGYVIEQL